MAGHEYLDFDLEVEPSTDGDGWVAKVVRSPAGEAEASFVLPFSDLELENFVLKVGRTRTGVRRLGSPQHQAAVRFGTRLYEALFADEVRISFRRSLDRARADGKGLRVRLRLQDAPHLTGVPWEYLYAPGVGDFLVLSSRTPLVRHLDLPQTSEPLAVEAPLRILVVVASPVGVAALDTDREVAQLREATADLHDRGLVQVDTVPAATLRELRRALRTTDYHVLHFIGHGRYDEVAGDGVLAFADEDGHRRDVPGQQLGTLLADQTSLRLAILNACEGGRTSPTDPFAGVAQSLVRRGVPAVVAMQFEVTDAAAIAFSHELYRALVDGLPVEAAVTEARLDLFSHDNDVEWGTPVLYLRARDGRLFDVTAPVAPPPARRPITIPPPPTMPAEEVAEVAEDEEAVAGGTSLPHAPHRTPPAVPAAVPPAAPSTPPAGSPGPPAAAGPAADPPSTDQPANASPASASPASGSPASASPASASLATDPPATDRATPPSEDGSRPTTPSRPPAWVPATGAEPHAPSPAVQPAATGGRKGLRVAALVTGGLVAMGVAGNFLDTGGDPDVSPFEEELRAAIDPDATDDAGPVATIEESPDDVTAVDLPPPDFVAPRADPLVAVVDGFMDEYARTIPDLPVGNVVAGTATDGFSADFSLAWDDTALRIFAVVRDDVLESFHARQPSQLFLGDAVHVELGTDPRGLDDDAGLRSGDVHVLIGVAADGSFGNGAVNTVRDASFVADPTAGSDVAAFVAPTRGGYLAEFAVPWGLLGITPEPGTVLGINLNASDAFDGGLGAMISSNPRRDGEGQARPGRWQTVELVG